MPNGPSGKTINTAIVPDRIQSDVGLLAGILNVFTKLGGQIEMKNKKSNALATEIVFAKPSLSRCFRFASIAFIGSLSLLSCSKPQGPGEKANSASSVSDPNASVKLTQVEVPADGKKFTPPVRVEQLPAGAWYCDMGTVHWAQMNEGDHKCPFCKMDLKQKK